MNDRKSTRTIGMSINAHGDWLPMRGQKDKCVAYDPAARRAVGKWAVSEDGRCHMANFIARRALPSWLAATLEK